MGHAGVQECKQCKSVTGDRGAGAVEGAGISGDVGVEGCRIAESSRGAEVQGV